MEMLYQTLLVVVLAVGTLVAVMLVTITQRLVRLRWQRSSCHTVPREDIPAAVRSILELPAQELAELGFVYRYSSSFPAICQARSSKF